MFIWQTLPTWFRPSARQQRITARSSTQRGDLGIPVADPEARLAVLLELALRGQQRRVGRLAHRGDGAPKLAGSGLPASLFERRLGVEQVDVARPAVHEAPDDARGPGGKVRRLGRERILIASRRVRRPSARRPRATASASAAEAAAGARQEVAAAMSGRSHDGAASNRRTRTRSSSAARGRNRRPPPRAAGDRSADGVGGGVLLERRLAWQVATA